MRYFYGAIGDRQWRLLGVACSSPFLEVQPGSTDYHAALRLQARGLVRRQRENSYRYDVTDKGREAFAALKAEAA